MIGKTELIKRVARELKGTDNNVTMADIQNCRDVCDAFVEAFKKALVEDGKISWQNFLTAEVVERSPRSGIDFRTGEKVTYPASKVISCKFSARFKNAINNKEVDDE